MTTLEKVQWSAYVREEKTNFLIKNIPRIQILLEVFELCKDNFDLNDLRNKEEQLYDILQQMNENYTGSGEIRPDLSHRLWEIFEIRKQQIEKVDVQLYYALLGFIDTLK